MPSWMSTTEGLGLVSAVGLGIVLSVLNPKDLTLAAAGGAAIASEDLSSGATVVAAVVFTAVAASTVVLPLAMYLLAGGRAQTTLETAKSWLIRHNPTVLAVIWVRVLRAPLIASFFLAELPQFPGMAIPARFLPLPPLLALMFSLVVTMTGSIYTTWRTAIARPVEVLR